ncbi:hypothetical protein [Frigoribacterium sp. PhB24]|uniref:hypothetical protein n=1 Tax=Frigoribacterium sp. PhB24 TaxID=2485204 RepID=UPI000F4ABA28|nr:hypothetical protein [Frigoribacterium sp. PhB24]ROS53038.1 hypothetical protein EDF50_1515 [Frigoribacterium sp. PhB24]
MTRSPFSTAAVLAVVTTLLVGLVSFFPGTPAVAVSGADFDAGNIISDEVYYNASAMTENQVQTFLDQKVGACSNGACLNVKKVDTASRPADAVCRSYQGAGQEPVSRVIVKVSQACGINPQVLLVTLQKEQSLVEGTTARAPSAARLDRATGYACPDTAQGGCDPSFAGVYNQLYKSAWQFKRYSNPAGTSAYFTWFAPGKTVDIQYNPNVSCGTKRVTIANQATAALYYYTPYTPNAAALSTLNGAGDSCSAYGNRNFWVYFTTWFGSTKPVGQTVGNVDVATGGFGSVTVSGWALDKTTSTSIPVHVYVGDKGSAVTASSSRPDVARHYPAAGPLHGFSTTVSAAPGSHDVCVYAIGVRSSDLVSCSTVTVLDPSPVGSLDVVRSGPGGVQVAGWALDPETADPISVHVYVGGVGRAVRAEASRPDIARAYPASGAAHGFSTTVSASPGPQQVCAYAINVGAGATRALGCRTVQALGSDPVGSLDSVSGGSRSLTVSGWTLDPDSAGAIPVHVYVDGVGRAVTADRARGDIARAFPAFGSGHGFSVQLDAAPGDHQVCVYAINVGPGATSPLGCRTVSVTATTPVGSSDVVRGTAGGVQLGGWALHPQAPTEVVPVHVYVDGVGTALRTGRPRPDVARAWPGAGNDQGYEAVVAAQPGSHDVCVYAIDTRGGANALLSCSTVVVAR